MAKARSINKKTKVNQKQTLKNVKSEAAKQVLMTRAVAAKKRAHSISWWRTRKRNIKLQAKFSKKQNALQAKQAKKASKKEKVLHSKKQKALQTKISKEQKTLQSKKKKIKTIKRKSSKGKETRRILVGIFLGLTAAVALSTACYFIVKSCTKHTDHGPYNVKLEWNDDSHFITTPKCTVNQKGKNILVEYELLNDQSVNISVDVETGGQHWHIQVTDTSFEIPCDYIASTKQPVNVVITTTRHYVVDFGLSAGIERVDSKQNVYGEDIIFLYELCEGYSIYGDLSYIEVGGERKDVAFGVDEHGNPICTIKADDLGDNIAFKLFLFANTGDVYTNVTTDVENPSTGSSWVYQAEFNNDIKVQYTAATGYELGTNTYVEINGTKHWYNDWDRKDYWDIVEGEDNQRYIVIYKDNITARDTPIHARLSFDEHEYISSVEYADGDEQYFDGYNVDIVDDPDYVGSKNIEIQFFLKNPEYYMLDSTDTSRTYVELIDPEGLIIPIEFKADYTGCDNILVIRMIYFPSIQDTQVIVHVGAIAR